MTAPPVAEATQPHAGFAPGGYADEISCLRTVSEIQAFILRERPETNRRFAERSARKLILIRENVGMFYAALRILGIQSDPTARTAVHKAECERAECDTCGRTRGER